jgi:hypothetical protein
MVYDNFVRAVFLDYRLCFPKRTCNRPLYQYTAALYYELFYTQGHSRQFL